jgi:signal transduction histidine kinase
MWKQRLAQYLIDPRYKRVHFIIIAAALVLHLSLHYATYVPFLRSPLGDLPYFRLHILHEAEFLLIVAYAGVVLGLRAGIAAVVITGVTSVPFILTPFIFGREPDPGEIRDLTLQVGFILIMGLMMVLLYDRDQRRRLAEQDKESLREMDRMRNNFMSMAAHELRTPMTTVMGFADLLASKELPDDQRIEWAGHIGAQAKRLHNLIEELLNVSRIAAGKLEVDLQPQGVESIANAALASVGYTPTHPIYLDIPDDLPEVSADRDKLLQVLVNLLSNAIKYSPNGGEIWLTARPTADGHVKIDIQDQGLGISEEDQAKLFTGFYRVQRPETEKIPGTGLGLSIVRSLIELMGGRVNVDSELGKGSTFSVALPAWREAAAKPSTVASPQAA